MRNLFDHIGESVELTKSLPECEDPMQMTGHVANIAVLLSRIEDLNRAVDYLSLKLIERESLLDYRGEHIENALMHLEGSTCECGATLSDIDAADVLREGLHPSHKVTKI